MGSRCILGDIEAAGWTGVVALEPGVDALRVEVVLAAEEEDFVAATVLLDADGADIVFACLVHAPSVKSRNEVVFHSSLFLDCVEHLFVEDGLESCRVHALDGRLVRGGVAVHDCLPLVVPVDEVEVVLA